MNQSRRALAGFWFALAVACVAGCAESGKRGPLTADEGDRLLRDVRSDRGRVQNLSPEEKAFLLKTMKK